MRALALEYPARTVIECDHPEPPPCGPHDVLFRILEIGVCGTDRGIIQGKFGSPPDAESKLVLGHEALGEVISTGSAVTSFRPGDLVAPMIRRSCTPPCEFCLSNRRDLCSTGLYSERGIIRSHGYFSERALDHESDLVRIPPSLREVAVLMEPLSIIEKGIRLALRAHQGTPRTALILGAGPIGILTALLLQHRGIEAIVYSLEAPNSQRARLVQHYGAAYTNQDPPSADLVIEAAGVPQAGFLAAHKLRPAGVALILGAGNGPGEFPFHDYIVGNRTLIGSVNADPAAFQAAARDLEAIGPKTFAPFIDRRPISDWATSLLSDTVPGSPKIVHSW